MRVTTVILLPILATAVCSAATTVDGHTTLYVSFDEGPEPDYCAGDWRVAVNGGVATTDGRIGQAIAPGPGQRLTYNADGKVNPAAGTVEMWLLWDEETAAAENVNLFMFVTGNNNYVRVNKISATRLGMAFNGGPADDLQWQRVDVDPSAWTTGRWHHIAGTWDGPEIALYVDGELVDRAAQDHGLTETPAELVVGPGPVTIDELRLSTVARPPADLGFHAAEDGADAVVWLTSLEPAAMQQSVGQVGLDAQTAIDDRELPLVIGRRAYARGVALRAPGYVEFEIPQGYERVIGSYGVSPFGPEGARADLLFTLEGNPLRTCSNLSADGDAMPLELGLRSGTLRIEARPAGERSGAVAIVGDLMALQAGAPVPPSFSREMEPDELALQQMRARVAEFTFELPDAPKGYVVYQGHPVDTIDPALEPLGERFPAALEMRAAPGEYEATQLVICAATDLPQVFVSATDLVGYDSTIPREEIALQLVRRVLQRKLYHMSRAPQNYDVTSRFLFPMRNFWLPEGNLKEIYVLVHVPADAAPGEYTCTLRISAEGHEPTEIPLTVEVLPIELVQPREKRYGMYYRIASVVDDPAQLHAEFADMAAHGCTMVKGHAAIKFAQQEDGTITWDFDDIRAMLDAGREHGFFGEITVYDNLPRLAALMGYEGLDEEGVGEPVSQQEDLLNVARRCFAELKQLEAEYEDFEFLLTHMDEVFGRGRMPAYLDYAEVIRRTSDFRIYITMHMTPGRWEDYMEQSDPWIDVRCINGHSLESWLQAGHDWQQLARMLDEAGDDGWIYHNMRGAFFAPEWNRFINGYFMWLSPLEVHVPWMYYSFGGSPFDDTDAEQYDFGYAFPSPEDPTQLLSTLHWEAFREGYDDMRYITTLERTIERAREAGVDVTDAEAWLAQVASMMPQLPEDIQGIDLESPYSVAAARSFSGADWDALRAQTADHIIHLQEQMGG